MCVRCSVKVSIYISSASVDLSSASEDEVENEDGDKCLRCTHMMLTSLLHAQYINIIMIITIFQ